jgi:hypothetical protein
VDIVLPAYLETLVRIPTTEKGRRLAEAQELQENVFCASGVIECIDSSFVCLFDYKLQFYKQDIKRVTADTRIFQVEW